MLKIKNLKRSQIIIILSVAVIIVIGAFSFHFYKDKNCSDNVAVIPIVGELISSPRYNADGSIEKGDAVAIDIVAQIRKASEDRKIKAIVFMIDSNGGDINTAEEITRAVKEVKKPTVAIIRSMGVSSAYWIASATGRIFALPTSGTIDIGVTNSYVDNVEKNKTDGLTFHQISFGKYKDMQNPDKILTPDEEKLAIAQTTEVAQVFIKEIAENRHIPLEKIQTIADGSVILGQDAIKLGLIDELGSFSDVDRYLSDTLKKNTSICIFNSEIKDKREK